MMVTYFGRGYILEYPAKCATIYILNNIITNETLSTNRCFYLIGSIYKWADNKP